MNDCAPAQKDASGERGREKSDVNGSAENQELEGRDDGAHRFAVPLASFLPVPCTHEKTPRVKKRIAGTTSSLSGMMMTQLGSCPRTVKDTGVPE